MFRLFVRPGRLTGVAIPVALLLALVCLPSDASSAGRRGGSHGGHGGHAGGHSGVSNTVARQSVNFQAMMFQQQALQAQLAQIQMLQARTRTTAHRATFHSGSKGNHTTTHTKTITTATGAFATVMTQKSTSKVAGLTHHGTKPGKVTTTTKTVSVDNGLFGPSATSVTTVSKLKGQKHGKTTTTQTTVTDPFGFTDSVTALKIGKGKKGTTTVSHIAYAPPIWDIIDPITGEPIPLNAYGYPVYYTAPGALASELKAVANLKRPKAKQG